MAISQIITAGELDRRIRVFKLVETKQKGENNQTWTEIFSTWAKREDVAGAVSDKAGADTALFTVQFTIRYNTQFLAEDKIYETLRIWDRAYAPVYMRDRDGNVMYDLSGNPLLSLESGDFNQAHRILQFQELGRKIGMLITCEGWR